MSLINVFFFSFFFGSFFRAFYVCFVRVDAKDAKEDFFRFTFGQLLQKRNGTKPGRHIPTYG